MRTPAGLPASGLVAGQSLASILDISVGDTVTVTSATSLSTSEFPVVAFVDEPLGTIVYINSNTDTALLDATDGSSVLVTFTDDVDRAAIRTTLIVGFPGETEADFQELMAFVEAERFDQQQQEYH